MMTMTIRARVYSSIDLEKLDSCDCSLLHTLLDKKRALLRARKGYSLLFPYTYYYCGRTNLLSLCMQCTAAVGEEGRLRQYDARKRALFSYY